MLAFAQGDGPGYVLGLFQKSLGAALTQIVHCPLTSTVRVVSWFGVSVQTSAARDILMM